MLSDCWYSATAYLFLCSYAVEPSICTRHHYCKVEQEVDLAFRYTGYFTPGYDIPPDRVSAAPQERIVTTNDPTPWYSCRNGTPDVL